MGKKLYLGNELVFDLDRLVPSGGNEKLILTYESDGKAKWTDLASTFQGLEEVLCYGVEWDINVADPHITRIGNMSLHKTLPIQSQLRGCITLENKIMYWLDEDNWKYKKGGNPNKGEEELLARLDGYDGTVRVYCPSFYLKSEEDGDKRRVWLTTVKIDDSWVYLPEVLIDAYKFTILNTVPENMGYLSTLPVNSAVSVVNTSTYCRGGSNRDSYDTYLETDPCKTDLGKPRTYITRGYTRDKIKGGHNISYDEYKNIFYWLYVVEYANFNCLEVFNPELTSEGYHLGGLGYGVTTSTWDYWTGYNNINPIVPCGYCNDLGNKTGIKNITAGSVTFSVPRWRGFDNPFGDIWTNLDGIIVDSEYHPNNMSYVYTCLDVTKFADTITEDYKKVGEKICTDGYVRSFDLLDKCNIFAKTVGASNITYKCDYNYNGDYSSTLRTVLSSGLAAAGGGAGLDYLNSAHDCGASMTSVGGRSVVLFPRFSSEIK